ncbi:hypothetical protein QQF64_034909 [Cirrhinus molitorella]|uniref:Uncharacterized protein n=1 Tax=Cirrhinus molitorella TaxID=172907 RepID=A0ABR3NEZ5_9TELE
MWRKNSITPGMNFIAGNRRRPPLRNQTACREYRAVNEQKAEAIALADECQYVYDSREMREDESRRSGARQQRAVRLQESEVQYVGGRPVPNMLSHLPMRHLSTWLLSSHHWTILTTSMAMLLLMLALSHSDLSTAKSHDSPPVQLDYLQRRMGWPHQLMIKRGLTFYLCLSTENRTQRCKTPSNQQAQFYRHTLRNLGTSPTSYDISDWLHYEAWYHDSDVEIASQVVDKMKLPCHLRRVSTNTPSQTFAKLTTGGEQGEGWNARPVRWNRVWRQVKQGSMVELETKEESAEQVTRVGGLEARMWQDRRKGQTSWTAEDPTAE